MPDHPIQSRFWKPAAAQNSQRHELLEDELVNRLLSQADHLSLHELNEHYPVLLGFYNCLLVADVLLPVIGNQTDDRSTTLKVYNASGDMGIPAFTSENSLTLWDAGWNTGDADWMRQSFMTVCQTALALNADFLLINIAGPYGCQIGTDDLPYLASGLLPPPADLMNAPPSSNIPYILHGERYRV